jgi:hypothetical protein
MTNEQDVHNQTNNQRFSFGEMIEIEEAGFSFQPIQGFELEIDGSVYMYSEDGNLEISLVGGKLLEDASIADLNDTLAMEFMAAFDEAHLNAAGTDSVQDITGFLDAIHFVHAEEEGLGQSLICSPYLNQYFFLLVISSVEHWQSHGRPIFEALKEHIRFHPQFKPDIQPTQPVEHPDLTVETYEHVALDEELVLKMEKGDISLLMAARSLSPEAVISLVEIKGPRGEIMYQFDPETGDFDSSLLKRPMQGNHGEVCVYLPQRNARALRPGEYRFSFASQDHNPLQEIQVILRSDRIVDHQQMDTNIWLALREAHFADPVFLADFQKQIREALNQHLLPVNLSAGRVELLQPAPDELDSFATVNIDTELADCSYMIAESASNGRALHIGLVEQLTTGEADRIAYVNAISSGSPGMILSPVSPHACILVAWPFFKENIHALADAIIQQMIVFSGIETDPPEPDSPIPPRLTHDIAWCLRRHPLFYEGESG